MKKTILWLTVLISLCAFATLAAQEKPIQDRNEALKKQNEKNTATNVLIQQANDAINAKDWQGAISPLQQLIAADPSNWQNYSGLGDAQLHLGQYDQAIETYEKGIHAAESNTTVDPKNPSTDPVKKTTGIARMLTSEGNCYLKLKNIKEAIAAYSKAAALDRNPGVAYFNLCATMYNTGDADGAISACDRAIAADPNKADAYFIKGSLLIAGSTTDKKGNVQAPPGTVETLKKYLELAPNGPHAKDVKDMLEYVGAKVEATGGNKKE